MFPCTSAIKLNSFKESIIKLKTKENQEFTADEVKKLHFTSNPFMCTISKDELIFACDVK